MHLRDLKLRLRALFAPRRVEHDLHEELAFHVERETHQLIAGGLSPAEARRRALARFGSVAHAADECRDARGIAFIDATVRDILYAVSAFRRAPLVALTIITTVALGLGLVAVVFTFLNVFLFRVDNVPHPEELFAIERPRTARDEPVRFTRPQYDALRRETRAFTDVAATLTDLDSRIDGRMMAGALVTGNFFDMLGVRARLGRALMPSDDARGAGQAVMVLSHRGWTRLFANDPTVIGRTLLVNAHPYQIVGVMPEGFRGLDVGAPDYWAPLSLVGQFRPIHAGREDRLGVDLVGRLRPGVTRGGALAELNAWDAGRDLTVDAERARERERTPQGAAILLRPRQGTLPHPGEAMLLFTPLFFAFGLILMIGCANVANLLLARAVARQREIGIRLSLGASRARVIRQLLTESLLLALAAAALGFVISRLVLGGAVHAVMRSMAPEIADFVRLAVPAADWRVALFLLAGAIAATVSFGLAPAVRATRLDLVRTVRGELTRDPRQGRARTMLIGVQVTASALLLICAGIFLRSAAAAATADPGIRTADTVVVEIINESTRAAMVEAVRAEPSIRAVAATSPDPLSRPRSAFVEASATGTGGAAAHAGRIGVTYKFVSPEYFSVLGIDILRGRGFTAVERSGNIPVAVIAESLARRLWPHVDAVGQVMHLDNDPASGTRATDEPALAGRTFTIVGVMRDVAGFRLADFQEASVYVPISEAHAETSLIVRVSGDPEQARRALLQRLTIIDPNMGQVMTMRTLARMETYLLQMAFWLTMTLGGLALALTLSGLFSVLSYLVEQRRREIGVRMALGATARSVGLLVLTQALRPVGLGLLAGAALAAALGMALMATPAAAQVGKVVRLFDPLAYSVSLACIVAACVLAAWLPALRAARTDPIATLRQD